MEVNANKRILKNTIYLYLRMIVTMGVSLYTSRIVLDVLGACDYGVYNVIGGIVVLISILNSSMAAATQRFITFDLGCGDFKKVGETFSMSMTAHYLISILILILGETIGLFYVVNYLNVPVERHSAAIWVYQLSLFTIIVNFIRIPYHASVIAYEKMDFFAFVSIFEVLTKLLLVLLLTRIAYDKLVLYASLILFNSILCNLIYRLFCKHRFSTCKYYWFFDKESFKRLLSFFGWNFVGSVATAGIHQIGNILLNAFCGPLINAAYGVASQVSSAIYTFSVSFETAYTPQIVKLQAQTRFDELFKLMKRSALLSYYLLFIIAMPIFLNTDYILGLWLKEVPSYAGIFSKWLIIYFLIDSIQAPLWKQITATGNIKVYEIWLSIVLVFNIPLSYIFLSKGYSPTCVLIISAALNLVTAIIRTIHVKIQSGFPALTYCYDVVLRAGLFTLIYLLFWKLFSSIIVIDRISVLILYFALSTIVCLSTILLVGINNSDRIVLVGLFKEKILRNK